MSAIEQKQVFETKRLTVRKLNAGDFEAFHEMQSNPKVMLHVGQKAMTWKENKESMKMVLDKYQEVENDFWVWAVLRKEDQTFLGTCAIVVSEDGEQEIGYRFLEKYWGKGYASEICKGLLNFAFTKTSIKSIYAEAAIENIASIKILEASLIAFRDYFNEKDNSQDRQFRITKEQ